MEKQERLKDVLEKIISMKDNEYNFQRLYSLLQSEITIEQTSNNDRSKNLYLNNLMQTRDKQAEDYIRASKKSKWSAFSEFTSNFYIDVNGAISH